MIPVEQIVEKLLETTHCVDGVNSGCECLFLNFDTIGLKLYLSQKIRDNCFYTQEAAYARDLGPEASNPIYFKLGNVDIYGYFTELAEVWAEMDEDDPRSLKLDIGYHEFKERLEDIISKHCMSDLSSYNIGFIGDRPVCIDFGNGGFNIQSYTWDHALDDIKMALQVLN